MVFTRNVIEIQKYCAKNRQFPYRLMIFYHETICASTREFWWLFCCWKCIPMPCIHFLDHATKSAVFLAKITVPVIENRPSAGITSSS